MVDSRIPMKTEDLDKIAQNIGNLQGAVFDALSNVTVVLETYGLRLPDGARERLEETERVLKDARENYRL